MSSPYKTGQTTKYNGSSWTVVNSMNTARTSLASFGTQTAALGAGGDNYLDPGGPPARPSNVTESYNGTTWTTVNNLNTARRGLGGAGIQTAGLAFGGFIEPNTYTAASESWNGTSWTNTPSLNIGRNRVSGFGTQTIAIALGGYTPPAGGTNSTELWNGTSWTATTNYPTAVDAVGTAGTNTAGLAFGGSTPASPAPSYSTVASQEWTGAGTGQTQTVTVS
jgi:hypothetical protein